jgi:hypothetical protein
VRALRSVVAVPIMAVVVAMIGCGDQSLAATGLRGCVAPRVGNMLAGHDAAHRVCL